MDASECWTGLRPEMCCVPSNLGTPWCFDQHFTYELCCSASAAGIAHWRSSEGAMPQALKGLTADLVEGDRPSWRPDVTVDLFVRSFHGKMQDLRELLIALIILLIALRCFK